LTEFGALRNKAYETVSKFIQIFNKLYSKILAKVKPYQPTGRVTFAGVFDFDFELLLRERRDMTLAGMQDDVIKIEPNMMASRKLKTKVEIGIREPRKFKEQGGPSGSWRSAQDEK